MAALFPLLIGIGLKAAAPHGGGSGNGPGSGGAAFFNQLAGNGVFLTFIALSLLLILVLPVVVAVVSGDSIAGEAGYGTLRYLLAVPAGRTRLLLVKYAAIVAWCVAAVFIVSAVALAVGAVLFPVGPVTLLSGTTVSLASGLVRVLWVTLYICAAMAAVGAIGLAISTFTEHAIGAIAAVMILVVASEVVDNIPQFATVAPYLPTHWWNSFDALLRTPVDTTTLWHGLLSFLVYAVAVRPHRLGPLHLLRRNQLARRRGYQVKSSSQNSVRPRVSRLSDSWARSSTRRILPEMVLGRSANSTRRIRL